MGWQESNSLLIGTIVSLIFQTITGALLVADLRRPDRFLRILLRPQWKSWLAIGAYILTAFGGVSTLVLLSETFNYHSLTYFLAIPGAILAILSAIYSGFLFAQAEGRDFWQSRLTTPHLFFQAVLAGAGAITFVAPIANLFAGNPFSSSYVQRSLMVGLVGHLSFMLLEAFLPTFTKTKPQMADAKRATKLLTHGPYWYQFWVNAVFFGALLPTIFLILGWLPTFLVAFLGLTGLYTYERLWIKVGQAVPLS